MQPYRPPRQSQLHVSCEVAPPTVYVQLSGELDLSTAHHLALPNALSLSSITMILLDLLDVRFCDASGVDALVNLRNEQMRRLRSVWITRTSLPVRVALELAQVVPDLLY